MRSDPFVRTERLAWDEPGTLHGAWAETRLIPITIGTMIGCIALSAVTLLQRAIPGWNEALVVLFCSVAAVEAAYSYRLYRRDLEPGPRRLLIQAVELTTLCVVRQVWETVLGGRALLVDGVPRFDPHTAALFSLTSGLIFLSWWAATGLMRCLDTYPALTQRQLAARCLLGGVMLFLLAGLSQAPLAAALQLPPPARSGPAFNVVLYCVLGLALLAQAQQQAVTQRQERGEIVAAKGFSGRLLRHTVPLIALAALLALLVPNSRLLSGGQAAWSEVSAALNHINIDLPLHHASAQSTPVPISHGPPSWRSDHPGEVTGYPPETVPTSNRGNPFAFIGRLAPLLKIVLLWLVLLASLAYRLRRVQKRKHQTPGISVPVAGVFGLMHDLWKALWQSMRGSVQALGQHLSGEARLHLHLPQPTAQRSVPRLHRLSPREHVLHSFLRFLHEAERRGFERDSSQTPQEFSAHLSAHVAEGHEGIETLARAFVEARYSEHEVGAPEIERVRASRRRARAALRSIKPE